MILPNCTSCYRRDDPVATAELNDFVLVRLLEQISPHKITPTLVSEFGMVLGGIWDFISLGITFPILYPSLPNTQCDTQCDTHTHTHTHKVF